MEDLGSSKDGERVDNGLVHVQGLGILFWIQIMMALRAADNGISMLLFL